MNIWQIVTPEKEYEIEIANKTLLYQQHLEWHKLTRHINSYFNERNSEVEIFEDGVPLNKKDWNCYFIPYDVNIQLTKVTANSPLKDIQYDLTEQLIYSPLFQELSEIWEQLNEELEYANKKLSEWNIQAYLNEINEKFIGQLIQFRSTTGTDLSPIDVKSLLLNIILEKRFDKKTLIIIELPELFASIKEVENFLNLVDEAVAKGYRFVFISDDKDFGVTNYMYKMKVINKAVLSQIKSKVCNEVPFHCPDQMFEHAKTIFLQLVDNSISEDELIDRCGNQFGAIVTILNVMLYNLDMEPIIVPQGLEPHLKKFIASLR